MIMTKTGALAVCLTLAVLPASAIAQTDQLGDCQLPEDVELGSVDTQKTLAACTEVLANADLAVGDRANALNNRGLAYRDLNQHLEAIADYSTAIALDDEYGSAFYNRGLSRESLGDNEGAVADWLVSLRYGGGQTVDWWQAWMRDNGGHYRGPIDGVMSSAVEASMLACARDPNC
jgi:tetratricopeptide (TPR) repeat protein